MFNRVIFFHLPSRSEQCNGEHPRRDGVRRSAWLGDAESASGTGPCSYRGCRKGSQCTPPTHADHGQQRATERRSSFPPQGPHAGHRSKLPSAVRHETHARWHGGFQIEHPTLARN